MSEIPNLWIKMQRKNLDNIPEYSLPEGCSFQWYKSGMEQCWLDVHIVADTYNKFSTELYHKQFGQDADYISKRQLFIINPDNQCVGTASAWPANSEPDNTVGMVHWVAIHPDEQGKGLAKPLISLICKTFAEQGYHSARLDTSTVRVPAVNLYLHFGFVPDIANEEDKERWQLIKPHLKYDW